MHVHVRVERAPGAMAVMMDANPVAVEHGPVDAGAAVEKHVEITPATGGATCAVILLAIVTLIYSAETDGTRRAIHTAPILVAADGLPPPPPPPPPCSAETACPNGFFCSNGGIPSQSWTRHCQPAAAPSTLIGVSLAKRRIALAE